MTEEANTYLNEALDYIQQQSVRRERIDWSALRQEVLALAMHAQTPRETYPAIQKALELLGDRHSIFIEPEPARQRMEGKLIRVGLQAVHPSGVIGVVYPGSAAERAGVCVGNHVEKINGLVVSSITQDEFYAALQEPQVTLVLTSASGDGIRSMALEATPFELTRLPGGHRLADALGYLEVPNAGGLEASKMFATQAHQAIREIDQTPTSGWVLDLRRNTGGALYPMLAAVGPIAGNGELMGFFAHGERLACYYRGGEARLEGAEITKVEVAEWYALKKPLPPVAVLTSQLTASSGELTALAFRGRPHTRSFGEPTRGVTTGNDVKVLADGAWIALTVQLGADRTGQTYDGPLLPDELLAIEWTQLATSDDPVLQAAINWLRAETISYR